ncbi:MAG: DUF928 domain-containing protein [Microcoleus sp. PH2017_40_RAT_O_B]|uniref:DUF928 domain-containing protein n=1 Tax=unclassified Microcoleus TaxID=2642155 RepID=UPI001D8A682D|nr:MULTISPECIES: DUF928 domain-containing protein [unclassified Microcoleus]MCC3439070.1 DUF928 domain-containing protein [Microcoleus sp. PH2017_05_CCC_O_A]MCC3574076.1 DUF928 domain-containing protein [Microcoleus sp. PH2017_34_RAT_O_A]MCC3611558.1 DUF928 domain-containing protein [Microcoleus sp. PH2017_40_RAT_O_B]TAG54347.1 MAG: DUF928 domain-containing protein [Oscillatoriales cyanobacterium]
MKRFLHFTALAIAVLAIAITLPSLFSPMQAVPAPTPLGQNVNFTPPEVTAPENRQGGAHRGCQLQDGLSITPLIPESNIGLTLTESPTFFVYVSQPAAQVEFVLLNEDESEVVYESSLKVDKAGIVGVSLSDKGKTKNIEVGKRYVWSFALACDPQERSGDYIIKGWMQRVEPQGTLKSALANPDPRAKLIAYAKNGIWYETLATLAQMRSVAPDDARLKTEWTQLLKSQKLEAVADKPLVQSF